jgi:hypothetical protein
MAFSFSVSPVILHVLLDIVGCIVIVGLFLGLYALGCYCSYRAGYLSTPSHKCVPLRW